MKNIKTIIIIGLILSINLFSCKTIEMFVPVDYTNYEVEVLEQGNYQTVLLKVYSYAYSVDDAIQRAKMDAVHAVLFKGIPNSNIYKPMVGDGYQMHKDYFDKFFGLYIIKTTKKTIEDGKVDLLDINQTFNAPYRLYVQISNDGTIDSNDRLRVGNKYKVGVVVSVNIAQLRKQLENDKIIRSLSSGF